ncbi:MAG: SDR family oxidoreductase [Polyangiaceae bacterium]|nr:SDR family oxidoreductase [Polyangiaceae bacterium]
MSTLPPKRDAAPNVPELPGEPPNAPSEPPSAEALRQCLTVLEAVVADRALLSQLPHDEREALLIAAGRVSRPGRTEQRVLARALRKGRRKADRDAQEATLATAPIRKLREQVVFITPPRLVEPLEAAPADRATDTPAEPPELSKALICYVCKEPYHTLHSFYDQLCPACGDFNFQKRGQTANLEGRTALLTGARVKIGYQAAILLLRAGARVIVSTRFPADAARRYAREADFGDWGHRLILFGLDLRHTPSVERFARHLLETEQRLDFILHNACQTVRRPAGFYQHLLDHEQTPAALPEAAQALLGPRVATEDASLLPALLTARADDPSGSLLSGLPASAALTQLALTPEDHQGGEALFPERRLDADEQQVDLRAHNSWRLPLHQVSTVELLEVQLVNVTAPFILNARLKPLMERSPEQDKHIVNVSAVEGQFYRRFKTDKHPHTNMAKAALNMMTRTSASDYVRSGIHMNSVDTGWVTDEDPAHIAARKRAENGFHPPLDIVDGAARIVDPIFHGFNTGEHLWGRFLKDYKSVPW